MFTDLFIGLYRTLLVRTLVDPYHKLLKTLEEPEALVEPAEVLQKLITSAPGVGQASEGAESALILRFRV